MLRKLDKHVHTHHFLNTYICQILLDIKLPVTLLIQEDLNVSIKWHLIHPAEWHLVFSFQCLSLVVITLYDRVSAELSSVNLECSREK